MQLGPQRVRVVLGPLALLGYRGHRYWLLVPIWLLLRWAGCAGTGRFEGKAKKPQYDYNTSHNCRHSVCQVDTLPKELFQSLPRRRVHVVRNSNILKPS